MTQLHGISGSLLPGQFMATAIAGGERDRAALERPRRQFERWWHAVTLTCGPATGVRAIFDAVAMPLCGAWGFRASRMHVDRTRITARLDTTHGVPIALVVMPWAARPSTAWRDASDAARAIGAGWTLVLAPPFLSLVDARGHAARRNLDFNLSDVTDPHSFAAFWTLTHASAFDRAKPDVGTPTGLSRIDALVATAATFQDRVRADLQAGVADALRAFRPVVRAGDRSLDESLTLVYRILFLLFAESRDLVPRSHPVYRAAYLIGPQCRDAARGGATTGLWDGLAAITRLSRLGCRVDDLVVSPFNGRLFARSSARTLETGRPTARSSSLSTRRDAAMARALAALGTRRGPAGLEGINYADLGVEQLGAVYERVLDLDPDALTGRPPGGLAHSAERKRSGTFYTPQPLVELVVRRTLAPLLAGASSDAILNLRVVDPAMGSGAFLVAACRHLAGAYARALVDEGRAAESDLDDHENAKIRRSIAERCLFGVDANPVAVQLARLSLWLTTLSRGRPLSFLDHRLRVGDSLIGAAPDDLGRLSMRRGTIPTPLFDLDPAGLETDLGRVTRPLIAMSARPDDTVGDVRAKEIAWSKLCGDASPLRRWRTAANLWCARWFWPGAPPTASETRAALDSILRDDRTIAGADLARLVAVAQSRATAHQFFHWPLEFPDVFYDDSGSARPRPGFDAVIGNPPWEMLRRDSTSGPRVPLVRFIRDSGLYPSCDRGHVNMYQPFLERALSLARSSGRVGLVLPWGLAVDDGAAALRARLLDRATLDTVIGFDNADGLFPIHRGVRFLVAVVTTGGRTRTIRAKFGVMSREAIDDLPARDDPVDTSYPIRLSLERLAAVGAASRRIPDARAPRDLDLLDHVAAIGPALGAPGWNARFGRDLNATDDRDSLGPVGLPVIEGKHVSPFGVNVAEASARIDPVEAARRLPDRRFDSARLAYRDVSGVANRTSLIAAIVPAGVVMTHTLFCLRTALGLDAQLFLCGLFNSFVLNRLVRLLMGGHVTTSLVEDLPVPTWNGDDAQSTIVRLARRLVRYPASGRTHAALQAEVARLYRLDVPMFEHVLAGFPLVPASDRQRALGVFARMPHASRPVR